MLATLTRRLWQKCASRPDSNRCRSETAKEPGLIGRAPFDCRVSGNALVVIVIVVVMFVRQVMHGRFVAATEALAIIFAEFALNVRMAVGVVIVRVSVMTALKVVPCRLDSLVKSLPLCFAEFRRRLVPSMLLVQTCGRLGQRGRICFGGHQSCRCGQCESKC